MRLVTRDKITHNTTVYTHPKDGFVARVAGLSKCLLIASLTEDLFLLKHKGSVVQLLVASAAGEVLRVPHPAHCTCKWATACEGERGKKIGGTCRLERMQSVREKGGKRMEVG